MALEFITILTITVQLMGLYNIVIIIYRFIQEKLSNINLKFSQVEEMLPPLYLHVFLMLLVKDISNSIITILITEITICNSFIRTKAAEHSKFSNDTLTLLIDKLLPTGNYNNVSGNFSLVFFCVIWSFFATPHLSELDLVCNCINILSAHFMWLPLLND